jgi:hypothetical protein
MGYYRDRWRDQPQYVKIPLYVVFGAIAAVGFGLLFGIVIRELWNWLMPMIFGLPSITFWQGVGLFILAKILVGGCGSGSGSHSESHKNPRRPRNGEPCGPAGRGPMERDPEHGFRGWRFYDEWWESEGKASFDTYADRKRPAPPTPPEPPREDE